MAVTPQQHQTHTAGLGTMRASLGLPKLPNMGDLRLNKSGTVGTEPIGVPIGNGGMKRVTQVKLGKLGSFNIPDLSGKSTFTNPNAGKFPASKAPAPAQVKGVSADRSSSNFPFASKQNTFGVPGAK